MPGADALWGVHDLAQGAKGNHTLCMELDAYVQDILRVFDAEGARRMHSQAVVVRAHRTFHFPVSSQMPSGRVTSVLSVDDRTRVSNPAVLLL